MLSISTYALILCLALSSQATACLFCFSTKAQRLRVCRYFLGHTSPEHDACLNAMEKAFQPYTKIQATIQSSYRTFYTDVVTVPPMGNLWEMHRAIQTMSELEMLKDTFSKVIFYLEERGMAEVPYSQAIPEAAEEVKKEVVNLKAAEACIPPCGIQEVARRYKCDSCRIYDCQLPVDCPVIVVHKHEWDITLLKCEVKFALPPGTTVKWRFAKDLNTQYLTLFKDLYHGFSTTLLIRPTRGIHQGTYSCQIVEEGDVLVRKYFYLNVTTKRLEREKELQKMFRDILYPPPGVKPEEVEHHHIITLQDVVSQPDYLQKKNVIILIIGLALISMLFTMIALTIYHWATNVGQPEP